MRFKAAFSRKFSPVNPPAKSQISRSAPPFLTPSKILTDIFRTEHTLTHCKTRNHKNTGNALQPLTSAFLSCDHISLFERNAGRLRGDLP